MLYLHLGRVAQRVFGQLKRTNSNHTVEVLEMIYICQDCNCHFHSTDQGLSEQKFGQCPGCGSENIKEKEEE